MSLIWNGVSNYVFSGFPLHLISVLYLTRASRGCLKLSASLPPGSAKLVWLDRKFYLLKLALTVFIGSGFLPPSPLHPPKSFFFLVSLCDNSTLIFNHPFIFSVSVTALGSTQKDFSDRTVGQWETLGGNE